MSTKRAHASQIDPDIQFLPFARLYLKHRHHAKAPATRACDRHAVEGVLTEAFHGMRIRDITRTQVRRWYEATNATRALSVLSQIMQHAEELGIRPEGSNPCRGLRRKQTEFRARYASPEDYRAIAELLQVEFKKYPQYVRAVWCMLLTGMRRGEVCGFLWSHIDNDRIVIRQAKHHPRVVWLTPPLQDLLHGYPRLRRVKHVFCNKYGAGIQPSALTNWWGGARRRRGLDGFRLHDFRHSYVSVAVNTGVSLRTTGDLLGHTDRESTLAYAHLSSPRKQQASEQIAQHIAAHLGCLEN